MSHKSCEKKPYTRAPIIEAVIDLRVTQPPKYAVEQLAALQENLADSYPKRENVHFVSFSDEIRMQPGEPHPQTTGSHQQQHIGYRFTSIDGHYVLQARVNGFTFSVLPRYESWVPFRDEARRLWNVYCSVSKPQEITRAAVRYINRLDFPQRRIELTDYLRTLPEVSPFYPHGDLGRFFMQVQIPQPDLGAMLVLNEASVDPPDPNTVSVVLDFDLFRETDQPWSADTDEVWEFLEKLRMRKNELFEASIKKKTRELIQ